MFKREQCLMLPRFWYIPIDTYPKKNGQNKHFYIFNDEKIEEGDWYIENFNNPIYKADHKYYTPYCKKIIASTNILTNLPQLSQSFIEKYVDEYNKGYIITDVMVEYEVRTDFTDSFDAIYGPAYKLKINPKNNTITIKNVKE